MNNMIVHKNAYSGGIKKRIGRSDLQESGASRGKARASTPKCMPLTSVTPACAEPPRRRQGTQACLHAEAFRRASVAFCAGGQFLSNSY